MRIFPTDFLYFFMFVCLVFGLLGFYLGEISYN